MAQRKGSLDIDGLDFEVENEEGFRVAAFSFREDAEKWVEHINTVHPCACYNLRLKKGVPNGA